MENEITDPFLFKTLNLLNVKEDVTICLDLNPQYSQL
jgi:hypothetical protein